MSRHGSEFELDHQPLDASRRFKPVVASSSRLHEPKKQVMTSHEFSYAMSLVFVGICESKKKTAAICP